MSQLHKEVANDSEIIQYCVRIQSVLRRKALKDETRRVKPE